MMSKIAYTEIQNQEMAMIFLQDPFRYYAFSTQDHPQTLQSGGCKCLTTDYQNSIWAVMDQGGNIREEMAYDPWGYRRDATTGNPTYLPGTSGQQSFSGLLYRGYTFHEHLDVFGLINMNGRLYAPQLGRKLSPDNFVQNPSSTQNFNRYSYVLNNPLKYTDPDGEWVIPALVGSWLLFTESGYEVQKYVSPVAVHVNVHLFSSEQKGIGVDASVGIPKALPISYRAHAGATYYWQHYDDSYKGWETRYGGEWTFGGAVSYSGTTFNSGGTSQTTNMITIGGPYINFKYENDYMFGAGEYIPGVPAADGGDRYRTAAARLKVGPFKAGINMFTGDPGLDGDDRIYPEIDGRETYAISKNGDDPNKYRSGVFYIGLGPVKIGRNSEKIRHVFQNKFAHDFMMGGESPYFQVLDRDPSWYFYYGSGTGNSLW